MDFLRHRIERQVISLTGLVLGGIDYERPKGDPGLFGPGSVCWRVHGDFPSMLCGGISALMLQMLHPLALAGVWDHSNFRDDMIGRLRRTSRFIAGTTFASTADAERLIEQVKRIHDNVKGTAPDGRPYSANDPELLVWVHVAEVRSFLASYLRYRNPGLSVADQDRYYDEVARIAEALGAVHVPRSRQAVDAYLASMRPQLVFDERAAEVLSLLLAAPAPSRLTGLAGRVMTQAGLELLPAWARDMMGLRSGWLKRQAVEQGMHRLAPTLRWALRNGASHKARRRVGLANR
ncbi:MAG: oxygenase MpaB family protein [Marinobacter sp.]|uniref:oxygenase MpaB family protein n=1 Tax=Marinobacter sp. TaxID=50741 RepID=UPI00299E628E|nr:oxygenase MpaB family protein [Marinobacter sp.]MDX1757503.1 oxygenase MpaB family protein [Marinobacter sp.]